MSRLVKRAPRGMFRKPRLPQVQDIWDDATPDERKTYYEWAERDTPPARVWNIGVTDANGVTRPFQPGHVFWFLKARMRLAYDKGYHRVRVGTEVIELVELFRAWSAFPRLECKPKETT